jgi:hypothetical protein
MPSIAGIRGTGSWGTDERPKNFREYILWRDPNGMAPLTALLSKMSEESTDDPEFSWWEEQLSLIRVTTDATGASSSSTSLGLVSGGYDLVKGDLLLVEKADQVSYDNEIVEVSSVSSDTAITIVRGVSGTSAAAIGASAKLTKIGNRYEEGSLSPSVSTRNPTKISNYCQIFKTAYKITRSAKQTKSRTGDPLKNDKKRKAFDHSVAIEMALLFGKKHETTGGNGLPLRTTGGLRSFISSNVTVFATTPTINTFIDAVAPVFDYSGSGAGNERIAFCGNGFLTTLNKLIAGASGTRVNYNGKIDVYGMKLMEFIMPQGTVYLRTHPLLNTHDRYKNSAFVLDPSALTYRYLQDTKDMDNIQANDEDAQKGQWLSEIGLEVHHERTMAYLGNFTYP